MNDEAQSANFNHLKLVAEAQLAVRRCEKEGSVWEVEAAIAHANDLGLISCSQYFQLMERLEAPNPEA